ncbi:MAG: 50S ribosomal protein L18 [Janthinobacterium lividum]
MITATKRNVIRKRVHARVRAKVEGTAVRPRLNVFRSLNHIYAQIIDDASATTLAAASTITKKGDEKKSGGNTAAAATVGRLIAEQAKDKGVTRVVFDRGGYLYHGRVKALADAAREAGLEF